MNFSEQRGVSTFWGVSIILMESVVVFFIFYILYFFWIENPTPTSNILIVRAVTKQAVVIPDSVETAGWLNYTNDIYGFSFQYPSEYQLKEADIAYGENEGAIISLADETTDYFSLIVFPALAKEEIPEAFERLTGVRPTVYQSFSEEVDEQDAVVYRQRPGRSTNDRIYWINGGYFFESAFNYFSADILATFKFISR